MLCTNCHLREATVIMNVYMGDEKKRIRLCSECAQMQGSDIPALDLGKTLGRMIMILLGRRLSSKKRAETDLDPDKNLCSRCGALWADTRFIGRLGCPVCNPKLIDRVRLSSSPGLKCSIEPCDGIHGILIDLKRRLRTAIENENYEEAVVLRDRIYEIESKNNDVIN